MIANVNKQVKSKKRVTDHGEVFTGGREVDEMLNLVKSETERIDSRFLEPTCGEGNFLIEIFKRKMKVVKSRYGSNIDDYEKYSFLAMTSIYGVDLLEDNVQICQLRLLNFYCQEYSSIYKKEPGEDLLMALKTILDRNILCGDALTLKSQDESPIIFSEWAFVNDTKIKRRDFRLDEMLDGHEEQMSIFMTDWEYDDEVEALIPKPIKEFPLIDFKKVHNHE